MKKTLRPLGLYIHIPFCAQKCIYCDFYSLDSNDPAVREAYLKALKQNIEEASPPFQRRNVSTIQVQLQECWKELIIYLRFFE